MIYCNVTYTLPKENVAPFIEEVKSLNILELTRKERGNNDYSISIPVDREDQIFLKEAWDDQETVDEHHKSPNFMKMGELKAKYNINTVCVNSVGI